MEKLNYDINYLKLLSKSYPSISKATSEIINLNAILHLPKGTEHFLSDIHGEYEAFAHFLRSGSGVIKDKIDEFLVDYSEEEKNLIATIIYYPKEKLDHLFNIGVLNDNLYKRIIYALIDIAKVCASKYSRLKVRKKIKEEYQYIIEELLHAHEFTLNRELYYSEIVNSIIERNCANEYIEELSNLIRSCAVDHLHILGDIYDRGDGAFRIVELLKKQSSVDVTWGNHDIAYMGAAAGNRCCIANVIRTSCRYNHLSTLEEGYGISLRPLVTFAIKQYGDDPCTQFIPDLEEANMREDYDNQIIAKMHKAITIIQFKLEGQLVDRHPNYQATYLKKLSKIDFNKKVYVHNGQEYKLIDTNFPTIDVNDPYKLTKEEDELMTKLKSSFRHSEKLQDHIDFLFSKGSMYLRFNDNILFHGCIPFNNDGTFLTYTDEDDNKYSGRSYLDYCDKMARKGYYGLDKADRKSASDFYYFLWCMSLSPLFGKSDITTFERYFLCKDDFKNFPEEKNPYYTYSIKKEYCCKILEEFGLDKKKGIIINGHMPVKIKKGEQPIKAGGKQIIIDGGISKAYQKVTGIAGYTLVSNSHGTKLIAHEVFESKDNAIVNNHDILHSVTIVNSVKENILIKDTYNGMKIQKQIEELKELVKAYQSGLIASIE